MAQSDTKHYIPALHGRENEGEHFLTLSTEHPTPFTVQVKNGAGSVLHTVTISATFSQSVYLGSDISSPVFVRQSDLNTTLTQKGLILEGAHPFSAHLRVKADEQAASLVAKGKKAAGHNFRLQFPQNNGAYAQGKTNTFSIMATTDNTLIQLSDFQPGVVLYGYNSSGSPLTSSPQNVQLDAGESMVFAAYLDDQQNVNLNGLDGLQLSSTQPIVVNAGSWIGGNAQLGLASGIPASGRDIGIDQLLPLEEAGLEYLAIKGNGVESEHVKITAAYDQTSIQINSTATYTLSAGETKVLSHADFSAQGSIHIVADKAVFVGQMLNAANGYSDDIERQFDFVSLMPLDCHGTKSLKISQVNELGTAQLKIIAESGHDVLINGNPIGGGVNLGTSINRTLYTINSGLNGDIHIESNGLMQVYHYNLNGHQGAVSHYAGFTKELFLTAQFQKEIDPSIHLLPEGCGGIELTLSRSVDQIGQVDTVYLSTSGTATEGTDYSAVPNFVIFQQGDTSLQLNIDIFSDMLFEATETGSILIADDAVLCGVESVSFKIRNANELDVTIGHSTVSCPTDTVNTNALITGGIGPYSVNWSYGDSAQQSNYITSGVDIISVEVTDFCNVKAFDTISLGVDPYNLSILSSPDMINDCPYESTDLFSEVNGGQGNYTYNWLDGNQTVGQGNAIKVYPASGRDYIVIATDACGVSVMDTVSVSVVNSLLSLDISDDTIVCPFDSVQLQVVAQGGKPPYNYNWENGLGFDSSLLTQPSKSTTYQIEVHDACATYTQTAHVQVKVQQPEANFHVLSEERMVNLPISLQNTSSDAISWHWKFSNANTSYDHSPNVTYEESGWHNIMLIATDNLGCQDSLVKPIYIDPEFYFYAPNSFTPNGDGLNSSYSVSVIGASEFEFNLFDRWGNLFFTTNDPNFQWDGTHNYEDAPEGIYVYKCMIVNEAGQHKEFMGHITLLR